MTPLLSSWLYSGIAICLHSTWLCFTYTITLLDALARNCKPSGVNVYGLGQVLISLLVLWISSLLFKPSGVLELTKWCTRQTKWWATLKKGLARTLFDSTMILLLATSLHFTLLSLTFLVDCTSLHHDSAFLYFTLRVTLLWIYFTLLHSTSLYHSSTSL